MWRPHMPSRSSRPGPPSQQAAQPADSTTSPQGTCTHARLGRLGGRLAVALGPQRARPVRALRDWA
eukprot:1804383-Rhodomonas_salina.1